MTHTTIATARGLAAALCASALALGALAARAQDEKPAQDEKAAPAQEPKAAEAAPAAAPAGKSLGPLVKEQVGADDAAVAAQERINALSDETREMLLQYRQYLRETKSLREYREQLEAQVASQVEEIVFVEGQLVEIETTAREVLPLMQKMLDTLERFVALDLPFQLEERRKRVAGLRDAMARADVTISEKYRRIVEAYQIEADYGRTLEAYQGELGEGAEARTVRFLRLGRIALLYQTLDGEETGYYDADQKRWVVDDAYRSAVRHGFAVADKSSAPDLLEAPVPAPREGRS
jgi:pyruvate/2-oxoglutarate dehydrogenase complex dihydrolipoamide acyltransferase (E2) component